MDGTSISELETAIGRFLLRGSRARLVEAALTHAPDGLDTATYPVLSGLARTGTISTSGLAAEIGVDRSVASRQADRLAAAGLVEKTVDAADARVTLLRLTTRGRRAIARSRQDLVRHLGDQLAGLPDRKVQAAVDVLTALSATG